MRLPIAYLTITTVVGLALTARLHSNPPDAPPEPAKPCCSNTTTLSSGQKFCFEFSQPEIVFQARQPACGIQRCNHFLHRPWFGGHGHAAPIQTVPFAFAPTQAVPVQTLNFAPVQTIPFAQALTYAPAQSFSFAPAQAMTFAPAQTVNFAPTQVIPYGFGQAAPAQVVPIFLNAGGQNQSAPLVGGGQAVGQPGGGSGAVGDRKDLNETLKELNKNLDGMMKIVERHTEYIVDHNTKIKALDARISTVENFLLNEVNSKLPALQNDKKFKKVE